MVYSQLENTYYEYQNRKVFQIEPGNETRTSSSSGVNRSAIEVICTDSFGMVGYTVMILSFCD